MPDSVLWSTTRGAGFVSLILFSAVASLGLLTAGRWQRPGWPRFLTAEFHSNLALLAVVFLAVHIVSAVVDPFTSLGLTAAVVPFSSAYKQLWLGLGGVALYLIVAMVATSLVRSRLGHRAWRAVHWLAYAAWPVAVVHGLGTGSDSGAPWAWIVDTACVSAVLFALAWRIESTRAFRAEIEAALPVVRQGDPSARAR